MAALSGLDNGLDFITGHELDAASAKQTPAKRDRPALRRRRPYAGGAPVVNALLGGQVTSALPLHIIGRAFDC
jgi:hypothetical protein